MKINHSFRVKFIILLGANPTNQIRDEKLFSMVAIDHQSIEREIYANSLSGNVLT